MRTTAPIYKLGYAPQSAVNRVIKDGSRFDTLFPPATNDKVMLKQDGEVSDTIEFMKEMVKDYNYQTAKIARKLAVKEDGKLNVKATCKRIWQFVVDYVKYNLEKGEQLRTPSRTWHDAQIMARQYPDTPEYSADCDCMSLFVGCILFNLKIPFSFRITAYADTLGISHGWQHVYTIAHSAGENIIIDPVYHTFNAEKKYEDEKTFPVAKTYLYPMSLNGCDIYQLSGAQCYTETEVGDLAGRKARREARREKRKARKDIRKAKRSGDKEALKEAKERKKAAKKKLAENRGGFVKAIKKVGKGIANFAKKSTMLLPRSMFMLLIRLNFRGMATKFANNENAYQKFLKTWKKVFGGKEKKLKKAVEKGKNKKALFGSKKNVGNLTEELNDIGRMLCGNQQVYNRVRSRLNKLIKKDKQINGLDAISYQIIGDSEELGELGFAATAAVSSAVASATPIIKKAIDIFKKVGDAIPESVKDAIKDKMMPQEVDENENINYDTDNVEDEDEAGSVATQSDDNNYKQSSAVVLKKQPQKRTLASPVKQNQSKKQGWSTAKKVAVIGGGLLVVGGVVALLISKSKKHE